MWLLSQFVISNSLLFLGKYDHQQTHCSCCLTILQGGHKPGKPRILGEFCATSGKNCSIFSSSFKYLCKTAVDWVNKVSWISYMVRVRWWPLVLLELMWNDPWWRSLLHLLFVAIVALESLENGGDFFLLLCGHPVLSVNAITVFTEKHATA